MPTKAPTKEELDTALQELIAAAEPADKDTEARLVALASLVRARRTDARIEENYNALRGELLEQLTDEGPRIFVDADGHKKIAQPINPSSVDVDMDKLIAWARRAHLTQEQLDRLAPRKVDPDQLRRLFHNGTMSNYDFDAMTTIVPKTGHVRFIDIDTEQDG